LRQPSPDQDSRQDDDAQAHERSLELPVSVLGSVSRQRMSSAIGP
jgi:hypothetical protein